jgi:RNA polymerase sigma-70 factor (ECF subfamily)
MPNPPSNNQMQPSDADIVARVRAGESELFRVLVERHSRKVFSLAYRMTGNESDAEDIVQDTFLKAYRQLARFESRSEFGTWLYRIGANCALDSLRSRKSRDEVVETVDDKQAPILDSLPAKGPLPDSLTYDSEVRQKVGAALALLTAAERAAFVLRHYQGMSIAEIGKTMGLKDNATKNTIFRAVQKLRNTLEPILNEF